MSPYVGMARKQNGGYNGSISVQTPIFHLVVNYTRMKTLRSAVWRCPKLYITLRVFKNVAKVANLEAVKIQFRHLLFLSSSFFSQPSAFTRAIPKTKHPRIVVNSPGMCILVLNFSETAISNQRFDDHDPVVS